MMFKRILSLTLIFLMLMTVTVNARPKTAAEKEVEQYSLKQINTTREGQRAWYNYVREQKSENTDPNKNMRLRSIMANLSNSVAKNDTSIIKLPYMYFVNNDTTLNAFCTFGHVMSVNSGTFDQIKNDDELAVIIAHEIGHGQKDHPYKSYRSTQQKLMFAGIAGIFIGGDIVGAIATNILLNQSIAHGTKRQERQADNLAFDYILNSNYNPGACAAVWQRFLDISGTAIQSKAEMFFTPADHPNNLARRDNYVKKLHELSGKKVNAENAEIIINGKKLIKVAKTAEMSAMERSYFIFGNLALAYHKGENKHRAEVVDGTVYLGEQEIITPVAGDDPPMIIAEKLNEIK